MRKEKRRFEVRFSPHGDWPMADGSMSTPDMHAETYVRETLGAAGLAVAHLAETPVRSEKGVPVDGLVVVAQPSSVHFPRTRESST